MPMRKRTTWRKALGEKLTPAWRSVSEQLEKQAGTETATSSLMKVGDILDIELGIFLLETSCPREPVATGYELLSSYPWSRVLGLSNGLREDRLQVACHLLAGLRTRSAWEQALEVYWKVPEYLRGYQLCPEGHAVRRNLSIVAERFVEFERALETPPEFSCSSLRPARAGEYVTSVGQKPVSVRIPGSFVPKKALPGHDLKVRDPRGPVTFRWDELAATAKWLDEQEAALLEEPERGHWLRRFRRLHLRCRENGKFVGKRHLTVSGVMHLIGMVGSGKSSLMILMAVCAARRGRHVTLVVGDVVSALRQAATLSRIGIFAAPVIGASNQLRHLERLHHIHASQPGGNSRLTGFGPEHDLLSTACALDALRNSATSTMPWGFQDAPCRGRLFPVDSEEQTPTRRESCGCPLWENCQRHRNSRDLVRAQVWITTPAGLLYCRVPAELNREDLRYLELVWRRSDLVIVDEADQVQTQFDAMFSPGQVLFGGKKEAWLESLGDHTRHELREQNRAQLAERPARQWTTYFDRGYVATNRLYGLLQRDRFPRGSSVLRKWIGRDCFNTWTLTDKLVRAWSGGRQTPDPENPRYQLLRETFREFLRAGPDVSAMSGENPLATGLAHLARDIASFDDEDTRGRLVRQWMDTVEEALPPLKPARSERKGLDAIVRKRALQIEFVIHLHELSTTLNRLVRHWRSVEELLNLKGARSMLFQRPPEDYTPVVPAPPMGEVLGFQYQENSDQSDTRGKAPFGAAGMGELRFFRCTGIGRWVLLQLD